MTCNIQSFFAGFNLNPIHLFILSTLAGYLLAAPASLRVWIALQKTPSPPSPKDALMTWKKKALAFGFILLSLSLECALFFQASPQVVNGLLFAIFGFFFFRGTTLLSAKLLPSNGMASVHRNTQGVPIIRGSGQKCSKKRKAAIVGLVLASLGVTVAAFITNHPAPIAILTMAAIYKQSHRVGFQSMSMRWMIIGLLGYTAGAMLFTAILVFINYSKEGTGSSASDKIFMKSAPVLLQWSTERAWVFPPLYSYIPGMLIALCLRFDYQRHLDSSAASEFILSSVPAPEPRKGRKQNLGEGVVVPSRAPTTFSKVYYATALVAWGLTQLGLLAVNAFTKVSFDSPYEFSAIVLFLELPIMCLALLAAAVVRGEWRTMWTYKEAWTVKGAVEETLPSDGSPLIPEDEKDKETAEAEPAMNL